MAKSIGKKCIGCSLEKELPSFRSRVRNNKITYENKCKECSYEIQNKRRREAAFLTSQRDWYARNKKEISAKRKNKAKTLKRVPRLKKSKEEILKKIIEWQKRNPEKRNASVKKYHQLHRTKELLYKALNKDKIADSSKRYYINNKQKINQKIRLKRKDPKVRLRHAISVLIRLSLKNQKSCSIKQHLPYTIGELRDHLEKNFDSWMNWDNWGIYDKKKWDDTNPSTWTWQIDHIVPQSNFSYSSPQEESFQKCWSLENLRPYSSKQNILDGSCRVRHKVKINK
jgi:hypothetical protein